jgi:cytochrome c peroxidase
MSPAKKISCTLAIAAGLGLLLLSRLAAQEVLPLPGSLPAVKQPADNPSTPEKIALGKELFFDGRLSRTGRVACATCHDPDKGFSNGERFAIGVEGRKGTRSVPSLINVAYNRHHFWDGRATTLEEQALGPIQDRGEMDMPLDALVTKLNGIAGYRQQFQTVFRGEATAQRIGQAIAAYERTLISADTPFDRSRKGDQRALGAATVRGMELFFGQARCFVCHKGPNFTDDDFHNIGVLDDGPPDAGRRIVTGKPADQGKFKTPTLREVGRTGPYMHNGRFQTLREVVEHYNFGGVTDRFNDHRDEQLRVLYLNEDQINDLVHFLADGLTTPRPMARARTPQERPEDMNHRGTENTEKTKVAAQPRQEDNDPQVSRPADFLLQVSLFSLCLCGSFLPDPQAKRTRFREETGSFPLPERAWLIRGPSSRGRRCRRAGRGSRSPGRRWCWRRCRPRHSPRGSAG